MHTRRHRLGAAALLAGLTALPASASGQEAVAKELASDEVEKKAAEKAEPEGRKDGWSKKLSLGTTGSFTHSSNVVGADDGSTFQVGLVLDGALNLVSGQHDWDNELKIQHSQTRTPVVPKFVKSADSLDFKSTWLYHLESLEWLGPYARFKLNTQLFPGYTVSTTAKAVVRTDRDGAIQPAEVAEPLTKVELTDPFEPLVLMESAGAFANPVTSKPFNLKAKVGVAVQEIVVGDGYVVSDDEDTPALELAQLDGSNQAGAELEVGVDGEVSANVTWRAIATFFLPLVSSSDDGLTGLDGLNSDLGAGLSVKLGKYASLEYVLSAKKIPAVPVGWQVQNGLMLTAGFNLL